MMFKSIFRVVALVLGLSLVSCAGVNPSDGAANSAAAPSVNLLAIADWGMNDAAQREVAAGMVALAKKESAAGRRIDGVLCGGDNMYVKLTGIDDPLWQATFETMYDKSVLSFPFYIAPGNHDYRDAKMPIELGYAKAHPESRWKMPNPYCRVDLPKGAAKPLVTVLMLDSCKDQMPPEAWAAETAWLQAELAKPRGIWLIAVAHHPLFSNGDHGDVGPLQTTWGPLFKRAGLDLYLCGHDHDLQHLELPDWPMSFVLVGGGGAKTRPMRVDQR